MRIFSSRQVGKLVGADPSSVNRWIDSGKLPAYRTPGGHRRVLYEDLVDFLGKCGMPLPDELMPESKSLLIVDDDIALLRSLKRALLRADRSLEIETCSSGVDALLQIGCRKPDVVVLDVLLPGLDGVEVCQKIKDNPEYKNIRVIAITGKPSPALEKRISKAGASALLAKPFKPAALLELIQPPSNRRARAFS